MPVRTAAQLPAALVHAKESLVHYVRGLSSPEVRTCFSSKRRLVLEPTLEKLVRVHAETRTGTLKDLHSGELQGLRRKGLFSGGGAFHFVPCEPLLECLGVRIEPYIFPQLYMRNNVRRFDARAVVDPALRDLQVFCQLCSAPEPSHFRLRSNPLRLLLVPLQGIDAALEQTVSEFLQPGILLLHPICSFRVAIVPQGFSSPLLR